MKDRQQQIGNAAQWAFDGIAKRLAVEPIRTTTSLGDETHFVQYDPSGSGESRWLTFRPEHNAVDYVTSGFAFSVSMENILPPKETKNGVIFELVDGFSRGLVLNDGHAVFEVFPFPSPTPLESPASGGVSQNDDESVSAHGGVPDALQREIGASGEPSATEKTEGRERQPKVSWTGYVANDPVFGTTGDGSPRANFIVSEHLEEDKTVYHKVYTTKREAKRLQDAALAKGNRVKVEGYKQPRNRPNRDGTTTPEERIYAVHVSIYKRDEETGSDSPPQSS